jgi:hypothetical protein
MRLIVILLLCAAAVFAEPLTEGTYKGRYEGSSGASGDFRVSLAKTAAGEWSGEVMFLLGGQEVKCTVRSVQVADAKLKMVYSFDLQGTQLESMIEGELSGGKLGGKYRTQVPGDGSTVDEGTWSTAAGN